MVFPLVCEIARRNRKFITTACRDTAKRRVLKHLVAEPSLAAEMIKSNHDMYYISMQFKSKQRQYFTKGELLISKKLALLPRGALYREPGSPQTARSFH